MFFTPKWVKMIPANTRPNDSVLRRLEQIRKDYNIPHEDIGMRVLGSKSVMRRLQKIILKNARKQYPTVTDKDLLKITLSNRFELIKATSTNNFSIYAMSEDDIANVMEKINTFDELVEYIAELEAEEYGPDPDPHVGSLIDALINEDFLSPL